VVLIYGFKPPKRQNSRVPLNHQLLCLLGFAGPSLVLSAPWCGPVDVPSSNERGVCCSTSGRPASAVSVPSAGDHDGSMSGEIARSACTTRSSSRVTRASPRLPPPAQIVRVDALKAGGSSRYPQMIYLKTGYLLASFCKMWLEDYSASRRLISGDDQW
jgi:hypothetical protein